MKKVLNYLLISILFILPFSIDAAEIFKSKDGKVSYALELVDLKCDGNEPSGYFLGVDKDNNYVFGNYEETKLLKVNKKLCAEMSDQEVLKLFLIKDLYLLD